MAFDQSVLLIYRTRIIATVPRVDDDEIGMRRSRSNGNTWLRGLGNSW